MATVIEIDLACERIRDGHRAYGAGSIRVAIVEEGNRVVARVCSGKIRDSAVRDAEVSIQRLTDLRSSIGVDSTDAWLPSLSVIGARCIYAVVDQIDDGSTQLNVTSKHEGEELFGRRCIDTHRIVIFRHLKILRHAIDPAFLCLQHFRFRDFEAEAV